VPERFLGVDLLIAKKVMANNAGISLLSFLTSGFSSGQEQIAQHLELFRGKFATRRASSGRVLMLSLTPP
jgi:hypothetical protein